MIRPDLEDRKIVRTRYIMFRILAMIEQVLGNWKSSSTSKVRSVQLSPNFHIHISLSGFSTRRFLWSLLFLLVSFIYSSAWRRTSYDNVTDVTFLKVLGSVGHPIQHTEFKVVDSESGKVLQPGEKGIVNARGPQVMKGYFKVLLFYISQMINIILSL